MSEGGGLLGDYYTPHYEAPLGNRTAKGEAAAEERRESMLRFIFVSLREI